MSLYAANNAASVFPERTASLAIFSKFESSGRPEGGKNSSAEAIQSEVHTKPDRITDEFQPSAGLMAIEGHIFF